jgi:hypothetical protein
MKSLNPQLAKLAAEALTKLTQENQDLTTKLAAEQEEKIGLLRWKESIKLACQIAERDGISDYKTVLAKAEEIDRGGEDLQVITAGLKYASAREFSLGIVSEKPSVGNPDEDFVAYLMTD